MSVWPDATDIPSESVIRTFLTKGRCLKYMARKNRYNGVSFSSEGVTFNWLPANVENEGQNMVDYFNPFGRMDGTIKDTWDTVAQITVQLLEERASDSRFRTMRNKVMKNWLTSSVASTLIQEFMKNSTLLNPSNFPRIDLGEGQRPAHVIKGKSPASACWAFDILFRHDASVCSIQDDHGNTALQSLLLREAPSDPGFVFTPPFDVLSLFCDSRLKGCLKIQNKDGNTPLHCLFLNMLVYLEFKIVTMFIDAEPTALKMQNKQGNTPLMLAMLKWAPDDNGAFGVAELLPYNMFYYLLRSQPDSTNDWVTNSKTN